MTIKEAKTVIGIYGDDTSYFNNENRYNLFGEDILKKDNLENMFQRMGFGYGESKCLTAALKIAGADIK